MNLEVLAHFDIRHSEFIIDFLTVRESFSMGYPEFQF